MSEHEDLSNCLILDGGEVLRPGDDVYVDYVISDRYGDVGDRVIEGQIGTFTGYHDDQEEVEWALSKIVGQKALEKMPEEVRHSFRVPLFLVNVYGVGEYEFTPFDIMFRPLSSRAN